MPDGDEIDDVEEASADDDSPPPRNRQRLSCLMGVSRRTRCNFYAIVSKRYSGKTISAMSNQSMVGRWYWDIWGYEIVRTLCNEFKVEWKVTLIYVGFDINIPWKVILTYIIRWY